jgi:hypothetical protein
MQEIGFGSMNWIKVVHYWVQRQAFVLVPLNIWVVIAYSNVYWPSCLVSGFYAILSNFVTESTDS